MLSVDGITAVIFYGIIIALIYRHRKKFEFHAKIPLGKKRYFPIVAQLRTKLGLNLMHKIGNGNPKTVKTLAYIGIWVAYIGMIAILILLGLGIYDLFTDPNADAVITPVIPGAKLPGIPFAFPFWHTLISLFIVIVIHEFSHGVVSTAYKIPVKSSGYAQVAVFSAAFVEPDEKKLTKHKPRVQNAIFAAGPFSNFLTAGLVMLLLTFVFAPIGYSMLNDADLQVNVASGGPAETAGITNGTVLESINGDTLFDYNKLLNNLGDAKPGDEIAVTDVDGNKYLIPLADGGAKELMGFETDKRIAYMGIFPTHTLDLKVPEWFFSIFLWIQTLFTWIMLLSVGLGLGNLIPIGPIDGGRMWLIASEKIFGNTYGKKIWSQTSWVLFLFILIAFLIPFLRGLF